MSNGIEANQSEPQPTQPPNTPSGKTGSNPPDIEELLAAARIERAKVMAAKGGERPTSVVKRSALPPQDGSAVGHPADRVQARQPADGLLLEPASTAEVAEPRRKAGGRVPTAVMVAFACCFGLGFGAVFSLGLLVALGWVSLADLKGLVTVRPPPTVSSLSPADPGAAHPDLVETEASLLLVAPFTAVSYGQISPDLTLPANRDAALPPVMSPGPRLTSTGETLSAPAEDEPGLVGLSLAFKLPNRAELGILTFDAASEPLPVVSAPARVSALAHVVAISAPPSGIAPADPARFEGARPLTPTPAALSYVRAAGGGAVSDIPLAKPALDLVIRASLTEPEPGFSAKSFVFADQTAPPLAAPEKGPVPMSVSHDLPDVGGPAARPKSLAQKLAEAGERTRGVELFVHAPTSVAVDGLSAQLGELERTGFPLGKVIRVGFTVSKTHIRYYKTADAAVARAIAAEMGWRARDFTRYRGAATAGRIEVWMAGTRLARPVEASAVRTAQRRSILKAQQQARLDAQPGLN